MIPNTTNPNGEPINGLLARVSISLEQEDIETDEVVIRGIRVDSTCGTTESDFYPVEIEEK